MKQVFASKFSVMRSNIMQGQFMKVLICNKPDYQNEYWAASTILCK